jgi:hypothetical protein
MSIVTQTSVAKVTIANVTPAKEVEIRKWLYEHHIDVDAIVRDEDTIKVFILNSTDASMFAARVSLL